MTIESAEESTKTISHQMIFFFCGRMRSETKYIHKDLFALYFIRRMLFYFMMEEGGVIKHLQQSSVLHCNKT